MKITVDRLAGPLFEKNMGDLQYQMTEALSVAANQAAAMIEEQGRENIAGAGQFGSRWIQGLHVKAEGALNNMRITMTHDIAYAGIFEDGGVINGNPLLWIPLSGTDAVGIRARNYGDGLFSGKSSSGLPLLFSKVDKKPKYFGIASVTIPKKFQLAQIQQNVMANFRDIFQAAMKE